MAEDKDINVYPEEITYGNKKHRAILQKFKPAFADVAMDYIDSMQQQRKRVANYRREMVDLYVEQNIKIGPEKTFGWRNPQFESFFSEGILSMFTNAVVIRNGPKEFKSEDCYVSEDCGLWQVKACSDRKNEATSFSPNGYWQGLVLMDFTGMNGEVALYTFTLDAMRELNPKAVGDYIRKQEAGGRPRFSFFDNIIHKCGIRPYAVKHVRDKEIIELPKVNDIKIEKSLQYFWELDNNGHAD